METLLEPRTVGMRENPDMRNTIKTEVLKKQTKTLHRTLFAYLFIKCKVTKKIHKKYIKFVGIYNYIF